MSQISVIRDLIGSEAYPSDAGDNKRLTALFEKYPTAGLAHHSSCRLAYRRNSPETPVAIPASGSRRGGFSLVPPGTTVTIPAQKEWLVIGKSGFEHFYTIEDFNERFSAVHPGEIGHFDKERAGQMLELLRWEHLDPDGKDSVNTRGFRLYDDRAGEKIDVPYLKFMRIFGALPMNGFLREGLHIVRPNPIPKEMPQPYIVLGEDTPFNLRGRQGILPQGTVIMRDVTEKSGYSVIGAHAFLSLCKRVPSGDGPESRVINLGQALAAKRAKFQK
jgi:hypothetical protein